MEVRSDSTAPYQIKKTPTDAFQAFNQPCREQALGQRAKPLLQLEPNDTAWERRRPGSSPHPSVALPS